MRTSGYFTQNLKVGRFTYNIYYTFNIFDNCWYINIPGYASGIRISINRPLVYVNDGYLTATGPVDKYNFNGVTYVS